MQATNEQLEKMKSSYVQAVSDANTMLRDTVSATMESVSIMTKGCGDLCDCLNNLMQKHLEQTMKTSQTLLSMKDMNELVSTQNALLKNSYDSIVTDLNNISQLSTRIAQQAAEPVTKQVNATISKISKVKAA